MSSQRSQLIHCLQASKNLAGRTFSDEKLAVLASYYELVLKWNLRLPLTTITEPAEFAERQ